MAGVAAQSAQAHAQALMSVLAQLEPQALAGLEEVALANGLEHVVGELTLLEARAAALQPPPAAFVSLDPAASQALLATLCLTGEVAALAEAMAELVAVATSYLARFDHFPAGDLPQLAQLVQYLQELSSQAAAVAMLGSLLADYLPELGAVELVSAAASLEPGQATLLQATAPLLFGGQLCGEPAGGLGSLLEQLQAALVGELAGSAP